jgi:hypothetical protein
MTMNELTCVPVTEKTLVRRLRRHLAKDGERLLANRGGMFYTVGRYYIVDGRNIMMDHDVNLVALARELGALGPGECVRDDGWQIAANPEIRVDVND